MPNHRWESFCGTRVGHVREILTPRVVVMAAAVVGAFVLGSIAALYESVVLLGTLPIGGWALGTALGSLYLVFAVSVTAAVACRLSSVLVTVMVTVGVLLLLPVVGIAPSIGEWLPSHLIGGVDGLVRDATLGDYVRSIRCHRGVVRRSVVAGNPMGRATRAVAKLPGPNR